MRDEDESKLNFIVDAGIGLLNVTLRELEDWPGPKPGFKTTVKLPDLQFCLEQEVRRLH